MNKSLLPLQGLKVLEFEGNQSSMFCGMVLADYGADVIIAHNNISGYQPFVGNPEKSYINRGKRSIQLSVENKSHVELLLEMIPKLDIIIDPYPAGKLEELGINPNSLLKLNEKLIVVRITGFGQNSPLNKKENNNLIASSYSGIQSVAGTKNYTIPFANIADIAGGGASAILGILLAVFERFRTGKGQIIDVSSSDSLLYMQAFVHNRMNIGVWPNPRGHNLLDTGCPFYNSYQCADGKYLAVGCLEPKFFEAFVMNLGLKESEANELIDDQRNMELWPKMKELFIKTIKSKTLDEWTKIYAKSDACATPVIEIEELPKIKHFQDRKLVIANNNDFEIAPAPKLTNHDLQYNVGKKIPFRGEHNVEILNEFGISKSSIASFLKTSLNVKPSL